MMDLATLIGVGIAVGSILLALILEGSSPLDILIPAPILLVVGGTLGAAMAGRVMKDSIQMVPLLRRAFTAQAEPAEQVVDTVVGLAERARREGLLALEEAARDVEDPFLKHGLELAIDGVDADELRAILEAEIDAKRASDRSGAQIFTDMGGYAPTIGVVGTVVSLVHVLKDLGEPEKLGGAIASAFVATLWGVATANVLWLPLANRLKRLSELECARMELALEGILAIQSGSNPRLVARKLTSLLPPKPAASGEAGGKAA